MSRLSKLYDAMQTLRNEGLALEDIENQVSQLEEEIIQKEILPIVTESIAPALKDVQRELVLVVDYKPNEPISVHLSRKTNITKVLNAKTLTQIGSSPVKSNETVKPAEPHVPTKHIENTTKGLRVTFPDGTVIWHRAAINTFIETLRRIGLERIPSVNIVHGGYNLVSKDKRPVKPGRVWQHESDGWFIYSNISNSTKVEDLTLISRHFKLGLNIEEMKPE